MTTFHFIFLWSLIWLKLGIVCFIFQLLCVPHEQRITMKWVSAFKPLYVFSYSCWKLHNAYKKNGNDWLKSKSLSQVKRGPPVCKKLIEPYIAVTQIGVINGSCRRWLMRGQRNGAIVKRRKSSALFIGCDKRIRLKTFIWTVICLQNSRSTKNFTPLVFE